ncbi:retrotransposon protein, putative, ty1-copia subclass [Tanacetum coccineum]|uniref:Retrotransposon protein, putative, ty1-copia subclass n=1 Tax=Tanacetum coccineum TaxID=301880 RepID=A0ABQ5DRQ6_9ASTR
MVRSMMNQTTLPKSFWDYALETAARILNMVPTKKAFVKHDTLTKPDKLDPRSFKSIFIGYPKETMGYSFYSPSENKVFVARNAEFFESKLLDLKASGTFFFIRVVEIFESSSVAKGFQQTYGVDYEETFSPVADIRAIRILIAIAAYYDYEIWQMDVKTAFLNGHLSEEVYMEQPEGFVNPKYPNHVCKLKRSIYGLKQASRQWNKRFDDEIKKFGFTQNPDEPCVYLKASGSYVAILILYVDDILLMGNNIPMLQDVKSYLGRSFAMKDLGDAAYILGIKIYRDRSKRLIGLNQSAYIEKILKRFYMENSKRGTIPMQEKLKLSKSQGASTPAEKQRMQNIPYASAIGSIMYAVRCTRPDVAFAQNMTSRFQQNPGEEHWTAVKNILKYLRNTKDMFLVYGGNLKRQLRVSCYTDAGYLTDADNLKSQTGYVFVLNGGAVDWKSTKQSIFATSSIDVEYIAAFDASKEAVWIRKFISGLGIVPTIEEPISMYCDNTGAIAIAKDDGVTKGARHFRAKVHYLRETIKMGDVRIEKIDTDDNLADPFTKALAFPKHSELTRNIGLLPASSFM